MGSLGIKNYIEDFKIIIQQIVEKTNHSVLIIDNSNFNCIIMMEDQPSLIEYGCNNDRIHVTQSAPYDKLFPRA